MGCIGEEPPVTRPAEANRRFPIDRPLAEGVLFTPREMEHKWALFYYCGEIICISSWFRQVQAIAQVEEQQHYIEVKAVRGTFTDEGEDPEFTVRVLDYLLRSHAPIRFTPHPCLWASRRIRSRLPIGAWGCLGIEHFSPRHIQLLTAIPTGLCEHPLCYTLRRHAETHL